VTETANRKSSGSGINPAEYGRTFVTRLFAMVAAMLLLWPLAQAGADFKDTVYITTQKAGRVPFEHETHLSKLDNNCSACHNAIFHVIRTKNQARTMAEMEQGKSCGACHNKSFSGRLQLNNCTKCHPAGDIPIAIPDFGTLTFSHGKHLEMFTCSDCHNSIFRTSRDNSHYSMAQMEQGKSCGACHDGKTAFSVKGDCIKCHQPKDVSMPGDSLFSHKIHLDMSYECGACHKKLFTPGPNRINRTMADMENGVSCGACHDGKTAFSVKGDCQKCHTSVKDISFKAFNARFSHAPHTALFKCGDCHSDIFIGGARSVRYTMPQMEQGKSCGTCHDGKAAFAVTSNCEKCHPGAMADVTFQLKDAGTVSFSHNKHRVMFACGDCHNSILTTGVSARRYSMTDMERGKSCGACHDDKTAFGVKKDCSRCHPVKDIVFSDDARFSHDRHLGMYTCTDCHNNLFNVGPDKRRYNMSQLEKGKSCGACHEGNTAFSVKGDCDKCHKSTISVTFNVKKTGPVQFSHKNHLTLFKCSDCHNGIFAAGKASKRATMAEMEKGTSCGSCHDGKSAFGVKDSCTSCHAVKTINFKQSSASFSHTVHIAAYGCNECHPSRYVPGPNNKRYSMADMEGGQSCGSCHDDKTAFGVKGNCLKCHPGNPPRIRFELPATIGNVEFNHKVHLDKGYTCGNCHYSVIASGTSGKRWAMKEMDQGRFCGSCHGFSMAFSVKDPLSCERCHQKEENWRPQPLQ